MFDENTEELLDCWYEQFSEDHEQQKRLVLNLLDESNEEQPVNKWYQQFDQEHEKLKSDMLYSLPEVSAGMANTEGDTLDETVLKPWFDQFGSEHEEQRNALLASLPPAPTERSMENEPRVNVFPGQSWASNRWLQLAASILLMVTAGIFFANISSRPAYAFEAVIEQLRSAQRIYFSGTDFTWREEDKPESYQCYFERPNRFWQTWRWSRTQGYTDGRPPERTHLSRGHRTSNGSSISEVIYPHNNRYLPYEWAESRTLRDHAVWSRIELEHTLKKLIGSILSDDLAREFRFVGQSTYNSISCNLFEQISQKRKLEVYVSLDSPVPIATIHYMKLFNRDGTPKQGEKSWRKMVEIGDIRIDPPSVPIPDIRIPSEIEEEGEFQPLVDRFQEQIGESYPTVFIPFRLQSNSGVVVCWGEKHEDVSDMVKEAYKDAVPSEPGFAIAGANGNKVGSQSIDLGLTHDGTTTWHWVHVIPDAAIEPSRLLRWDYIGPITGRNFSDVRPSLDIGVDAIREAIRTAASDDESANAVWERFQESDSRSPVPEA